MYNFIDVIEASEGTLLPSEALKINGEYIENQIKGYRTLSVIGREALSPDVESDRVGYRDGSYLKNKRYPERIITVKYQIKANSNEAFREAYNRLGQILDVEDAELIFNDESDKFYIGTPCTIDEVQGGSNVVVGKIEILCTDPFKYSVKEYEASAKQMRMLDEDGNEFTGTAFLVDYEGTYKSFPLFESTFYNEEEQPDARLTGYGDCGYVAFINKRGKILQFGDPDELDGETCEKSQTLINQSFLLKNSWDTADKSWTLNNSVDTFNGEYQVGNVAVVKSFITATDTKCYLAASDYGTGATRCGPTITRKIPADASGASGASDFTLSYKQKLCSREQNGEVGIFHALIVHGSDKNRKILAGVRIAKHRPNNPIGKIDFYVNEKTVYQTSIDLSYNNIYFGNNREEDKKNGIEAVVSVKTSEISKRGNMVEFNIGGIKKAFYCYDDGFADMRANEITFAFQKYDKYDPLYYNGLYSAKFVKHNCSTFRNVPNKFSAGDILTADCRSGDIHVNSLQNSAYGALGNDWEDFYLKPGENQIRVLYSDWVKDGYAPEFKMRYREVYL